MRVLSFEASERPMYRWQFIPLFCIVAAFIATMTVLVVYRRRMLDADRRQALLHDLLRGPGESLRDPMQDAAWDAAEYSALGLFLVPLAFCIFPLKSVWEGQMPELETIAAFVGIAVLCETWILARLARVLGRARSLALGYEAELAVGQELDELRHLGYRIFHDVPADGLDTHIDHIVVGPAGVFAVAARGRDADQPKEAGRPWEVTYDGESLQFPGWKETLPLGQAMRQAEWLFEWIEEAIGEPVTVRPILVLPGWSVKRTAVSGIPVLAARRIQAYFQRMRARPEMTETMIERIAEQIDRSCRVVAVVTPPPAAQHKESPTVH